MKIGALQRISLIDYPGEICAIVFTSGCNFRCPYCHNPELVDGRIKETAKDEIFEFLKKRSGKLNAVSITGGEPTLHYDLGDFIKNIKSLGYNKIKLDTNGTNPDMLEHLIDNNLISFIAMDVKAPLDKYEYVTKTRCNINSILKSINLIKESHIEYEFRTTTVKNLLSDKDILKIAKLLHGAKTYVLQRFIPSKTLDKTFLSGGLSFDFDELNRIKTLIASHFGKVLIR